MELENYLQDIIATEKWWMNFLEKFFAIAIVLNILALIIVSIL